MKRLIVVYLLFISLNVLNAWAQKSPADYVNPIIGATTADEMVGSDHGLGKHFPVCALLSAGAIESRYKDRRR